MTKTEQNLKVPAIPADDSGNSCKSAKTTPGFNYSKKDTIPFKNI